MFVCVCACLCVCVCGVCVCVLACVCVGVCHGRQATVEELRGMGSKVVRVVSLD